MKLTWSRSLVLWWLTRLSGLSPLLVFSSDSCILQSLLFENVAEGGGGGHYSRIKDDLSVTYGVHDRKPNNFYQYKYLLGLSTKKEPSAVILCCMSSVSDFHIFSTVSITLIWERGFIHCERFEPRSHFKSRLSLIVRVNVVLNRTVAVDSDWRFDNLCGSHLQSHSL